MRFKSDKQRKAVMTKLAQKFRTASLKGNIVWHNDKAFKPIRKGIKDGISVFVHNPPWGRLRSPMVSFKIIKEDKVYDESRYDEMRGFVKSLKRGNKK